MKKMTFSIGVLVKHLPITLGFLLFFSAANAEDFNLKAHNGESPALGIGGTVFETWGFLYRQYFPSNFGIAGTIGGWMNEFSGKIGLAFGTSYTFAHHYFPNSYLASSSVRVYGIAYLGSIFGREINYKWDKAADKSREERHRAFDIGLGLGPGAEFFFNEHFAVHLELPWMTFVRFKDNGAFFRSSHPHIGGGISYYF